MLRWLTTALMMVPVAADALSCMRPNPLRGFNTAFEAEETYVMVRGSLRPVGPLPDNPQVRVEDQAKPFEPVTATYEFEGHMLGPNGRGRDMSAKVEVSVTCLAVWCGGFPEKFDDALMYLARDKDQSLHLDLGPCPSERVFENPTPALISTLQNCWQSEGCSQTGIEAFDRP